MATYNVHAGHNFKVPGAGGCFSETSEARNVKNLVISKLRSLGHTVYDCTDEVGTTSNANLANIVKKCNAHRVDLDISIHFNAFNGKAHGSEVFQYNSNTSSVCNAILNAICALGFTRRGVKDGTGLYVIRNTISPAILIECCFCDNSGDAAKYKAETMATAIVKGITGKTVGSSGGSSGSSSSSSSSGEMYRIRKSWGDVKSQVGAYRNLESAKQQCPKGYNVYNSKGVCVYSNGGASTTTTEQMYRIRKSWDDVKSQVGAYRNLESAKQQCPAGYNVYDNSGKCVYSNPSVANEQMYRVRKTWADAKSQLGAYKNLDNAKTNCPAGYNVYDKDGKCVYSNTASSGSSTTTTTTKLYRIRKTWADAKSQLGAYQILDNAKQNCPAGYSVFDWNGKVVYTPSTSTTTPSKPAEENKPTTPTTPEPEVPNISPLEGMDHDAFIAYVGNIAREDMKASGILASVVIAQAILESGWGQSELSLKANNLFGMKANLSGNTWDSCWDGDIYAKKSPEDDGKGNITQVLSDFRAYDNPKLSIMDHSDYFCGAMNGNKLRYEGLMGETDYKTAVQIIKDGGYATDSKYVDKLCNLIEEYNLDTYDYIDDPVDMDDIKDDINNINEKIGSIQNILNTILEIVNKILGFFNKSK